MYFFYFFLHDCLLLFNYEEGGHMYRHMLLYCNVGKYSSNHSINIELKIITSNKLSRKIKLMVFQIEYPKLIINNVSNKIA